MSMEKHKISVIIPVYNVDMYIEKCLDSIINQTYKNLEIILIDDGSTDGSGKKCDSYACKDNRIKVIHQKNCGLSAARNRGLDVATGEYIVFADSDDWIEPNMYSCLIQQLIENNADIVYCGFYVEKGTSEVHTLPTCFVERQKDFQGKVIRSDWLYSVVWNKMFKKSIIEKTRFNTMLDYSEDAFFLYEISKNTNSVYFFNKPLYHYNKMNSTSVTATRDFSKSLLYVREFFAKDVRCDAELHRIAIASLVQSFTMLINWAIKTKNIKKCIEWTNRLKPYKKDIFNNDNISSRKKVLLFLLFYFRYIYYALCYLEK